MYNDFSLFYDDFAYDIPYDKFKEYYIKIFKKYKKNPEIVLDMCCGTGTLTVKMAEHYDMIGIDSSVSMLNQAREKDTDSKILFLCQQMTDFELYGTVDCAYSSLDSINYLLSDTDIKKHFLLMHNYLVPDGLYIFDISTAYKLKYILGNNMFSDETENAFFVWQNEYENGISTMYLDIFKEEENGLYNRISEIHTEKAHSISKVKRLAQTCGFEVLDVFDNLTFNPPEKKSERIFFVLKCKKL